MENGVGDVPEEKMREIGNYLLSIKERTAAIRKQTEFLNGFSSKLEALLVAMDTYSEVGDVKMETEEVKRVKKEEEVKADPRGEIAAMFVGSRTNRMIAMEIHSLLESTGTVSLDELVKRIRQSKYRVINVLNVLVKERIVVKHFDKGFNYTLNRE